MATITISKKQFEKDIGKVTEAMKQKIAMFGSTVEEETKEELQLDIFPNRPDLLSYQGFKRSFLGFLGRTKGIKEYKINKPEKNYKVIVESSVKNVRPYTACAIVKGLSLNDQKIKEIIEIQEKLHNTLGRKRKKLAIGVYPLEKIKMPITFKALEPDKIKFTPLESLREMSGLEILQRHSTGKEYAHLLAGKAKFPIFLDANKNVLSMPPIINSQLTGKVSEKTRDVFIECSGFDFKILKRCLNILITTLADMGGKIYQVELKGLKQKTPSLEKERMKISLENTNKLLGLDLTGKQMISLIEKMGYNYEKGFVEIPAWRTDILHEVDLIEDIAIAYGYENFSPEIPNISTIGEEDPKATIERKIGELLAGLNMLEISNYHLTTKRDQFEKMGIPEKKQEGAIELESSKTEFTILRKDLAHYLLKIFSENVDAEYPQRIFEIGRVFNLNKGKLIEKERLSAAIAPSNFTEIKQILEYLFRNLDLEISLEENEDTPTHFIDGRCANIIIKKEGKKPEKKIIGILGEIHPKVLNNWKIKMPIALFELDLEEIFNQNNP